MDRCRTQRSFCFSGRAFLLDGYVHSSKSGRREVGGGEGFRPTRPWTITLHSSLANSSGAETCSTRSRTPLLFRNPSADWLASASLIRTATYVHLPVALAHVATRRLAQSNFFLSRFRTRSALSIFLRACGVRLRDAVSSVACPRSIDGPRIYIALIKPTC
ncbi:hypothetical protein VTI28DRAFT_7418 [Corynascus sepedonium]